MFWGALFHFTRRFLGGLRLKFYITTTGKLVRFVVQSLYRRPVRKLLGKRVFLITVYNRREKWALVLPEEGKGWKETTVLWTSEELGEFTAAVAQENWERCSQLVREGERMLREYNAGVSVVSPKRCGK